MIITDANAAIRVHDRMPVILSPAAARQWVEPGPLPAELLARYPAEAMAGWRVADLAKNSTIEPTADMACRSAEFRLTSACTKSGAIACRGIARSAPPSGEQTVHVGA